MSETAREGKIWLVGSVAEPAEGGVYNTLYWYSPTGEMAGAYRKAHLFAPTGEDEHFLAGDRGGHRSDGARDHGRTDLLRHPLSGDRPEARDRRRDDPPRRGAVSAPPVRPTGRRCFRRGQSKTKCGWSRPIASGRAEDWTTLAVR